MVVVASGETEEDKGRGERLALLQGMGMGNRIIRGPTVALWRRGIFLCESEVHVGLLLTNSPSRFFGWHNRQHSNCL